MTRIFSDLIDIAEVGREDSFFELGGDRSPPAPSDRPDRRRLRRHVQSRSCFRSADLYAKLAAAVQDRKSTSSWRSLVPIRQRWFAACRCTWCTGSAGRSAISTTSCRNSASGTARICAAASGGRLHRAGTDSCPLYSRDSTAAADRSVSAWRLLPRWMDRVRNGASTRRSRRVRTTVDDH